MAAIKISDLDNAKRDVDHIAAVATSTAASATDRRGNTKRTLAGLITDLNGEVDAVTTAAQLTIAGLGYQPPVTYAGGINLTAPTQTVSYSGAVYAPAPNELPFTTSGTFETAKFRLIHGVAVSDLAASGGSNLVGFLQSGSGAVARQVQHKLRDTISPEDFGAKADGVTDDTAALVAASNAAQARGLTLAPGHGRRYYVDGAWHFDCSIDGGLFMLGPSADVRLQVSEADGIRRVACRFENASGNDLLTALICESDTPGTKKGHVTIEVQATGFLNGVWCSYLKSFVIDDGCYFYSRNTVPGRYQEAHVFANHVDDYIVKQAVSDGGVLGFASGAGAVREFYMGAIAMNSFDHGFYSSSPTDKVLTVFNGVQAVNTTGSGIKCFSNGDLYVVNCTVRDSAKIGILPVANNAYVLGGSVINPTLAAVYQIGKEVGAGVNEFDLLVVKDLLVRGGLDDGVRVSGPDVLRKVVVDNCDIEVARRPVFITVGPAVSLLEVNGGRLYSGTSTEQIIRTDGPIGEIVVDSPRILADTTSGNLIDVYTDLLRLDSVNFRITQCNKLARNRISGKAIRARNISVSGTATSLPPITQDGGNPECSTEVFSADGNFVTVRIGDAAPGSGTWKRGDVVWDRTPNAGAPAGWICITAGTPGTWVPFAPIQVAAPYSATVASTLRSFDAGTVTSTDLARVVATLVADLKGAGVLS